MFVQLINSKEKYSETQIQNRVKELANQISIDFDTMSTTRMQGPLIVIGILKGAVPFCTDLIRNIQNIPIYVDYIQISSYKTGTSPTGVTELKKDITLDSILMNNHNLLIVEDIIDTGNTMNWVINYLNSKYTIKSLKIATLINKTYRRQFDINVDYVGFEDNTTEFLAGYGLDYGEIMRNKPNIVEILKEGFN